MGRRWTRLVVVAALGGVVAAAPTANGSPTHNFAVLKSFNVRGTAIGLFELDGPPEIGPVFVIAEFNRRRVVPGSYAGLITGGYYTEVQASTDGLVKIQSAQRPGGTQREFTPEETKAIYDAMGIRGSLADQPAAPLPGRLSLPEVAIQAELLSASAGTSAVATFPLGRPGDLDAFQEYFNPALPGTPHTHEFQFVIGNDRQIHPQPPLTPTIDKALSAARSAQAGLHRTINIWRRSYLRPAVAGGRTALVAADKAIQRFVADFLAAEKAGELAGTASDSGLVAAPKLAAAVLLDSSKALRLLQRSPVTPQAKAQVKKIVIADRNKLSALIVRLATATTRLTSEKAARLTGN